MTKKQIKAMLAEMIDAYVNDDGTDDLDAFITAWAAALTPDPTPATATPDLEVLVYGNPFEDGFAIEGPYPSRTLEDCEIFAEPPWWIVELAKPRIETT
jgi:hypothetical protein